MTFENKRFAGILIAIPVLLLIPFAAMRITDEVNWTAMDFVVMAGLLLITGLSLEMALRIVRSNIARLAACGAIFLAFLMVWGELATGYFARMFSGH